MMMMMMMNTNTNQQGVASSTTSGHNLEASLGVVGENQQGLMGASPSNQMVHETPMRKSTAKKRRRADSAKKPKVSAKKKAASGNKVCFVLRLNLCCRKNDCLRFKLIN